MKIIDNINTLLGDDLKASIHPKAKPKIAASCFSIYAYEALKSELAKIDSLEFIFTAPINPDFMKSRRISAFRTSTSFGTSKSPLALPIRFPAGAFSRKCKKRIKNHEHPDPHPVIVGKG